MTRKMIDLKNKNEVYAVFGLTPQADRETVKVMYEKLKKKYEYNANDINSDNVENYNRLKDLQIAYNYILNQGKDLHGDNDYIQSIKKAEYEKNKYYNEEELKNISKNKLYKSEKSKKIRDTTVLIIVILLFIILLCVGIHCYMFIGASF